MRSLLRKWPVIFMLLLTASCDDDNGVMCVAGDTQILTPNQNVLARKLKIGDEIFSYDMLNDTLVIGKIMNIRRGYDLCVSFKVDPGVSLDVTADHLIFSPETGTYEKASKWRSAELSEFYRVERGKPKKAIVTLSVINSKKVEVYDITVDSPFSNFIANGILVHNKTPPLNATPPVNDLEVVDTDSNSITLAWTVPGNAEIYPVEYDIRFLDREWQTGDYWTVADTVISEPIPSAPGSRDTMTVAGLPNSITYWFGMTTISNDDGYSNLSNIVSATTQ